MMGRRLLCVLLIVLALSFQTGEPPQILECIPNDLYVLVNDLEWGRNLSGPIALNRPGGRSLSSHPYEHETALVVALDGTIYLVDATSKKVLWSFSTGPSLCSSYLAPGSDKGSACFTDCGNIWNMFVHELSGVKLKPSIRECYDFTPHKSQDQQVLRGLRETSLFVVDLMTGKESYNLTPDKFSVHISRTNYRFDQSDQDGSLLWNVTVADIGPVLVCQGLGNSFGHSDFLGTNYNRALSCQSKEVSLLPEAPHADPMMRVPNSYDIIRSPHINPTQPDSDPVASLPAFTGTWGIYGFQGASAFPFIPLITILLVFPICLYVLIKQVLLPKVPGNINGRIVESKRKRNRKSGKLKGDCACTEMEELLLNLNQANDGSTRTIGTLCISNIEIAKGSNGTVVFEGSYQGRPVAVKRLVKGYHVVAEKEIEHLRASDQHSNIVRYHVKESDEDFVYIALERCVCNLHDLIQMSVDPIGSPLYTEDPTKNSMTGSMVNLVKRVREEDKLRKPDGRPSPTLLKLMRDVVSGLEYLHELRIVHRDLKPQNVLISDERRLRAKISDMGISKKLLEDKSSLGLLATGSGSSGWKAPEHLLENSQTRAVDLFSLGCVLFFCTTGGKHPFGDRLARDINIANNKMDLFLVEGIPEAHDLFSRLLDPQPELRPKAFEVLHHPFFWDSDTRLSFFRDTTKRIESEGGVADSDLLKAVESIASIAIDGRWSKKIHPELLKKSVCYRSYDFNSVRDLVRLIWNKQNHYTELPSKLQALVGPLPEGYEGYFAHRFPKLLIEVYKVMQSFCGEEDSFQKYFKAR